MRVERVEVDGAELVLSVFQPTRATGVGAILLNGWRALRQPQHLYAEALAERGVTAVTYDYRGCGDSTGEVDLLTRREFLADCLEIFDFVRADLAGLPLMRRPAAVLLLAALLSAPSARAEDAPESDRREQARVLFVSGIQHYDRAAWSERSITPRFRSFLKRRCRYFRCASSTFRPWIQSIARSSRWT